MPAESPALLRSARYGINIGLTIKGRDLRLGNYNVMKEAFLPIVVKIPASIFTIRIRFLTLLDIIGARIRVCPRISQCSRVNHAA
jgi:hypothetical protein